jgi:hypothetical protein
MRLQCRYTQILPLNFLYDWSLFLHCSHCNFESRLEPQFQHSGSRLFHHTYLSRSVQLSHAQRHNTFYCQTHSCSSPTWRRGVCSRTVVPKLFHPRTPFMKFKRLANPSHFLDSLFRVCVKTVIRQIRKFSFLSVTIIMTWKYHL